MCTADKIGSFFKGQWLSVVLADHFMITSKDDFTITEIGHLLLWGGGAQRVGVAQIPRYRGR